MKPQYLRICSDLHLEQWFGQDPFALAAKFLPPDDRDAQSVLCLAGDISSKPMQLVDFLRAIEKRFMRVIFTPGNHEFYGHDMQKWAREFKVSMAPGPFDSPESVITEIATLGMSYEEMDGVRFVWGTLWADGGSTAHDQAMVGRGLRDFYVIRTKDEHRFRVSDMVYLHKKQKAALIEFLAQPFEGKTVVMTHHMPSYSLCHPRFGNEINGGFASNCNDILGGDNAPTLWIHGHTHDSIDTRLGGSRIICNPSGYYFENDARYKNFKPLFLEIKDL